MTKAEIAERIRVQKRLLNQENAKKAEAERDYNAIEDFSTAIERKIRTFDDNISDRRSRLAQVTEAVRSINAGESYCEKVRNALYGSKYRNAVNNIDEIEKNLHNEKKKKMDEIQRITTKARQIRSRIAELQRQYDSCEA